MKNNPVQNPLIQIVKIIGKNDSSKDHATITVCKDYRTPPFYRREYKYTPGREERIRARFWLIYTGEMESETTHSIYIHFQEKI